MTGTFVNRPNWNRRRSRGTRLRRIWVRRTGGLILLAAGCSAEGGCLTPGRFFSLSTVFRCWKSSKVIVAPCIIVVKSIFLFRMINLQ
jgi:hypothetical protein